jgi:hypothetical protein
MDKETEKEKETGKTKMVIYLLGAFVAGALVVGIAVLASGSYLQGNLSGSLLPTDKQPCALTACQAMQNEKNDINMLSARLSAAENRIMNEVNKRAQDGLAFSSGLTDVWNRVHVLENTAVKFTGEFTSVSNQLKKLGQPGL